ncbi:LacI family transcriptional regulator [Lapidilactobacillus dextrinicus]|nr:LacI family transcriptional regulator [Lapidilactobacillus dextrinicus]
MRRHIIVVSIREVAKKAGVSVGSVSRYLNGQRLKKENMDHIQLAIESLGYRQNIIAKGLKNNHSFAIGLLMNNLSSRFSMDIVSSIEDILEKHGYGVIISGFNDNKDRVSAKLSYLRERSVDGLILFEVGEDWPGMDGLADAGIPVVSLQTPNKLVNVDSMIGNDRISVKTVLSRMVTQGNKKIGVIVAPQRDYSARERLLGVYDSQREYPEVEFVVYQGDYSRLSGYCGANELISDGVDALFVCNYNMSLGTMEFFSKSGLRIDTDIAFGHFDYLDQLNQLNDQRLVIQQPATIMGQVCAERLLSRINGTAENIGATYIFENQIMGFGKTSIEVTPTIIK